MRIVDINSRYKYKCFIEMEIKLETLLAPLREYEEYNELKVALEKGHTPINVVGGVDSSKCHLIYGLSKEYKIKLIITYNEIRAKELMDGYRMYDRNIMYYPAKDLIFYSADILPDMHCGFDYLHQQKPSSSTNSGYLLR